jgi:drug/metabolite transporter (DMT)-like permease
VTTILTLVFALATALTNAASATIQWNAASQVPPHQARGLRLASYLLRQPRYLAALGTLTLSFLLQAAALHEGDVVFVQPLLVTELPFTLVLAAMWLGAGLDRREILGSVAICGGLGVLLGVGAPHGGRADVPDSTWLLTAAGAAAVLVVLGVVARTPHTVRQSVLYAIASGVAYAMTAVLVKATTSLVSGGLGHLFTSWQPYAMVVGGVVAVLYQQRALHAGPLAAAKPATTIATPIASIALGIGVFQEAFRGGSYVAVETVGGLLLVAGVLELARSPLVTGRGPDRRSSRRGGRPSRLTAVDESGA